MRYHWKVFETIVFLKILLVEKTMNFIKKKLIIPTKICKQYGPYGTGTDQRQFEIVLSISDKVLE